MGMFGNLFKTRGAGVKYSKKAQHTKRKYIREKNIPKKLRRRGKLRPKLKGLSVRKE